jgi:hypothetical protein
VGEKVKMNKIFLMVHQDKYATSSHVYEPSPSKLILININFKIEIGVSKHFADGTEDWESQKIIQVCHNSNYFVRYRERSCR